MVRVELIKITLVGSLGKDSEVKYLPNSNCCCKYQL